MTNSSITNGSVHPVRDRTTTLDFVRGFVLLGILVSIIDSYGGSLAFGNEVHSPSSSWDEVLGFWMPLIINRRFIAIFSLLFGIGIAIQQQNFASRGVPFTGYFLRRMAMLALLGVINTTFFFWTEILLVYAVFGTVVYLISRWPRGLLLTLAGLAFFVWGSLYEVVGRPRWIELFGWFVQDYSGDQLRQIYSQGPFWAAAKLRWIEYGTIYADNGFHLGMSFAMILVGYLAGSNGWHRTFMSELEKYRKLFGFALLYSVGFGLLAWQQGRPEFLITDSLVLSVLHAVFTLATIFAYVFLLAALSRKLGPNHVVSRALANNGRLSLTGYMGGAGVYALIFCHPGLGWYAQLNKPQQIGLAIAVYLAFTVFSWIWLKRFERGPIEWVFRRLSYGRPLS
ncbi:DUF418 domain-containing protein [Actomonas aquatica]|uniref:DUF418 domain-containing protein n=1 Tax=Actomonas aquatica TaxID=2866162 RepID=A0ABZ1CEE5_9BACT|nr:DUF418 domain-containing protein [Opitutus sp. WL0086]WRQ89735.1 DUF418 domain-containing protein [Opitutus sp. WL0086]